MKEIWKDIPSFEGYYQVSNHGRIKALARTTFDKNGKAYSRKEHIVQPSLTRTYYKVHLSKENKLYYFSVHRLVALAFIRYQQDLNGMLEQLMFQSEVTHVSFLPSPHEDRERKNPSHHR